MSPRPIHDTPPPLNSALPDPARALELPLAMMAPPLDWAQLFGRAEPNAVEIGTGNGYFLVAEAARLPGWNFIGIERDLTFYWKMVKRLTRAGLANARTTSLDATEVLPRWIPEHSLARVYCYFSDPWPKRRHAKNRVVNAEFAPLLERLLVPGGEFWFKTDVGWYFNLAVTVFRERARELERAAAGEPGDASAPARPNWQFTELRRLPPPDVEAGEPLTNFERKAREAGSEVWGFHARFGLEPASAAG